MLASLVVLTLGWGGGLLPWRLVVMGAAPLLQMTVFTGLLRRGIRAGDCIALTWLGAALLLAYHLWVVAGLPTELSP